MCVCMCVCVYVCMCICITKHQSWDKPTKTTKHLTYKYIQLIHLSHGRNGEVTCQKKSFPKYFYEKPDIRYF